MNPETQAPQVKKSFGPLVGIIVIIVVLALGAIYVWGGKSSQPSEEATEIASTTAATTTATVSATTTTATTTTLKK
ncbi:MAG: hypothetical protein WC763_03635 [Candidatus Paceibacterota bacterium]|jgi:flagellar basal body-associated protein FliL